MQKIFKYALEHTLGEELSPNNIRAVTPVAVTEENGLRTILCVKENNALHVIEGDTEELISAAENSFPAIEGQEPVFGIISDCAIRSTSMTLEQKNKEINRLQESIDAPIIGFYGYGEIGGKESYCTFNNQTVSGLLLTRDR
ncbi:MAG: FIST C-terminal domain-containing protein [Candidatus Nanohalobium sp.]